MVLRDKHSKVFYKSRILVFIILLRLFTNTHRSKALKWSLFIWSQEPFQQLELNLVKNYYSYTRIRFQTIFFLLFDTIQKPCF